MKAGKAGSTRALRGTLDGLPCDHEFSRSSATSSSRVCLGVCFCLLACFSSAQEETVKGKTGVCAWGCVCVCVVGCDATSWHLLVWKVVSASGQPAIVDVTGLRGHGCGNYGFHDREGEGRCTGRAAPCPVAVRLLRQGGQSHVSLGGSLGVAVWGCTYIYARVAEHMRACALSITLLPVCAAASAHQQRKVHATDE